jgi:hypothetical protein
MRDPIPVYVHLRRAKNLIDRDYAGPLDVPALLARRTRRGRTSFAASRRLSARRPTDTSCDAASSRAKELLRNTNALCYRGQPRCRLPEPWLLQHRVSSARWPAANGLRTPLADGRPASDSGLLHAHVHAPRIEHFREAGCERAGLVSVTAKQCKEERR